VIGNTYIYLIEKFGADAGKKAGEFFTPFKVTELVARLAAPRPGDKICDPACGSGGLLIQAAKQIGSPDYALFGQESNGATWALARMNMFLHGADSARIEWCDTLNNPALVEADRLMKFNVVVANPPFSLDKWAPTTPKATGSTGSGAEFPPEARATGRSSLTWSRRPWKKRDGSPSSFLMVSCFAGEPKAGSAKP